MKGPEGAVDRQALCAFRAASILVIAACLLAGQASDRSVQFEVSSIKPSPPGNLNGAMSGGPATKDPGLFTCENIDLASLLVTAFDIPRYRLSGPDWMRNARFNISAKIPPGTTKEQFRLMQQNLLIERLKMTFHHEKKEMQGYELVTAKTGLKIKQSQYAPEPKDPDAPPPPGPYKKDEDGFPVIPPDDHRRMLFASNGPRAVQLFWDRSMEQLALYLAGAVGRPVDDATGLKGKYDFTLKWIMDWGQRSSTADSGPNLFRALQEQLGLKLEAKKVVVDVLIIDQVEKTPTEN